MLTLLIFLFSNIELVLNLFLSQKMSSIRIFLSKKLSLNFLLKEVSFLKFCQIFYFYPSISPNLSLTHLFVLTVSCVMQSRGWFCDWRRPLTTKRVGLSRSPFPNSLRLHVDKAPRGQWYQVRSQVWRFDLAQSERKSGKNGAVGPRIGWHF